VVGGGDAGVLGARVSAGTNREEALFIIWFTSSENISKARLAHAALTEYNDSGVGVLRYSGSR
jgi:hypothetical protein